jgi:hypothetical protein
MSQYCLQLARSRKQWIPPKTAQPHVRQPTPKMGFLGRHHPRKPFGGARRICSTNQINTRTSSPKQTEPLFPQHPIYGIYQPLPSSTRIHPSHKHTSTPYCTPTISTIFTTNTNNITTTIQSIPTSASQPIDDASSYHHPTCTYTTILPLI